MEMTNEEVNMWRTSLELRKKAYLANEKNLKQNTFSGLSAERTGEISRLRTHAADLASDVQELETLDTISTRNIKGIQEIESALERIDKGSYGKCQNCTGPIAKARLQSMPAARFCIECEKEKEKLIKNNGPSVSIELFDQYTD